MEYLSMQVIYDGFIRRVLNGKIKLAVLHKYKLPEDLQVLADDNKKAIAKDRGSVGSTLLFAVIDVVAKAFEDANIPYREAYVMHSDHHCFNTTLRVSNSSPCTPTWSSGDYYIYTKVPDRTGLCRLKDILADQGIHLSDITTLDNTDLRRDPYKHGYDTLLSYIDSVSTNALPGVTA